MKFTKTQRGWAMYDWANSVYSLVISTVLFPLYYEVVTKNETNEVLFLGRYWENTVVYSYVIAASYLTISILSPYLAAMADRTGRRKVFMRTFMIIGALSTSCMGLFTAANPWLGLYLAGERRLYGFYCFLQQFLTGYRPCRDARPIVRARLFLRLFWECSVAYFVSNTCADAANFRFCR